MNYIVEESRFSRFLFANTKMSFVWLLVRLYVGYEWLMAGISKVTNPVWVGVDAGGAVAGFVNGALVKTAGAHPDVMQWYASFLKSLVLPHASLWSHIVVYGEILVGAGLILGLCTGIAAFFGVFMNINYLLAGTVSSNPVLLILGIFLVLAWRIAGFIGLDRFVLPLLGTPWHIGTLIKKQDNT
jgi:thiosulfate dehydrogenase [quinone] large subunit